jgi:general secretion pathway protein F
MVHGEMAADSVETVAARLIDQGLHPTAITHKEGELPARANQFRAFRRRRGAIVLFTRQLAGMLAAGVTLHAALRLLAAQPAPNPLQPILNDLVERLRDGCRFSEACARWPGVFSAFFVSMIRAGETGGMLELVLEHLADFLEKEEEVRKQIQAALAYPALMLAMGTLTISVLLTFVVPRIVSMFDEMGQVLPWPTRVLVAVSDFTSRYWLVLACAAIVLALAINVWRSKPGFKQNVDRLKLRLPVLGAIIVQAEATQFARTLSALLAHGVPVHRAFEVVIAACKNAILQAEFRRAGEAIRRGGRIGASLLNSAYLPAVLGQMISVAEETNQLETVLEKIAGTGARDVERRVALFTRLLEPAMIILLGAVIGFMVFAMMLPIFQMDFVVQ